MGAKYVTLERNQAYVENRTSSTEEGKMVECYQFIKLIKTLEIDKDVKEFGIHYKSIFL